MQRARMFAISLLALCAAFAPAFAEEAGEWERPEPDFRKPETFVHEWNRLFIEIIKIDGFTPTSSARNFAYFNIAGYEAALPSYPECRSMAGQLNGLTPSPLPEAGKKYDARVAIVAAYQRIAPELIYRRNISDSVADLHYRMLGEMGVSPDVLERSKAYGRQVGEHIAAWMKTDNFIRIGAQPRYEVPVYEGAWKRTPPAFWDPVDPYWSWHRTFVLDSAAQFRPPAPPPFSTDPDSEFYKMVKEVYDYDKALTMEQKTVATFWDCNPIHSFYDGHMVYNTRQVSPAGHWISITAIACETKGMGFMESLETYVRVGVALSDAFISTWDAKYHFNVIRPVTYIQEYIDSSWMSFIETPPFPEWTSGHSTISAAAASVLTSVFGDKFAYTDWTEAYLGYPIRDFTSFRQAAEEVSWSRVWGGIHYLQSCMIGMDLGWKIGDYVVANVKTRKKA